MLLAHLPGVSRPVLGMLLLVLLGDPCAVTAAPGGARVFPGDWPLRAIPMAVVDHVVARGPSMAELHRHVRMAAGDDPAEIDRWRKRAARAAGLPRLQLGMRHGLQDNLDLAIKDAVSVTSAGVVIGPRTNDLQERSDRNTFFEARAVWDLGELLFTTNSLRVSEEGRRRRQELRELLHAATVLYAEYRRWDCVFHAARLATPSRARRGIGADQQGVARMRMAEVTGELDALTDGWFSRAVEGPP